MSMLTLVKYHGLGNDFLVALDTRAFDEAVEEPVAQEPSGDAVFSGEDWVGDFACALCDRHVGVGADGLLILRPANSGGEIRMELRNADGSHAETSGNGLRCFALAAIEAGIVPGPEVLIETDAGLRKAVLRHQFVPGPAEVSVEMGSVKVRALDPVSDALLPESKSVPWPAWFVDAGNPHLVVLAPSLAGVAVAAVGPAFEKLRSGGQNVEIATREPGGGDLSIVIWERGTGVTLACGSGSVAAAAALHSAGMVADRVHVHNPGGTAQVTLSGDDPLAIDAELQGPVQRVCRVEVDPDELGETGGIAGPW
jgi:diaminopimelate epimerase